MSAASTGQIRHPAVTMPLPNRSILSIIMQTLANSAELAPSISRGLRGHTRVQLDIAQGSPGCSVVILDEVLPHPGGCTHEIAFRPGTISVTCRDLEAVWSPADCRDQH
ncbi:hypothetical protein Misp02_11110 [Microtetraspora sp. NBRC 16547]|nr:hypothetical protein Misp02_11110 [Microtetraspora sp. NBRC 16547]